MCPNDNIVYMALPRLDDKCPAVDVSTYDGMGGWPEIYDVVLVSILSLPITTSCIFLHVASDPAR